jgi:transposase InsO family protein
VLPAVAGFLLTLHLALIELSAEWRQPIVVCVRPARRGTLAISRHISCVMATALMRRIDELYTAWPFLGSRRITALLRAEGQRINRKRVQRLMRQTGIAALGPKPRTTKPAPGHKVFL